MTRPTCLDKRFSTKAVVLCEMPKAELPSSSLLPEDWVTQLGKMILQKKVPGINNPLHKHIGARSSYTNKKNLIDALKILFRYLQKKELSENERASILIKLREGTPYCTEGLHGRVNEILLSLTVPTSFAQLLQLSRESFVEAVASTLTDEVHATNTIIKLANQHGFGVRSRFDQDPYYGEWKETDILKQLENAFEMHFTPFTVPKLICDQLRGLLEKQGYTGRKSEQESYDMTEKRAFKALMTRYGITITEDDLFFTEEVEIDDIPSPFIRDLNWQNIEKAIFKLMQKQDYLEKGMEIGTEGLFEYLHSLAYGLSEPNDVVYKTFFKPANINDICRCFGDDDIFTLILDHAHFTSCLFSFHKTAGIGDQSNTISLGKSLLTLIKTIVRNPEKEKNISTLIQKLTEKQHNENSILKQMTMQITSHIEKPTQAEPTIWELLNTLFAYASRDDAMVLTMSLKEYILSELSFITKHTSHQHYFIIRCIQKITEQENGFAYLVDNILNKQTEPDLFSSRVASLTKLRHALHSFITKKNADAFFNPFLLLIEMTFDSIIKTDNVNCNLYCFIKSCSVIKAENTVDKTFLKRALSFACEQKKHFIQALKGEIDMRSQTFLLTDCAPDTFFGRWIDHQRSKGGLFETKISATRSLVQQKIERLAKTPVITALRVR